MKKIFGLFALILFAHNVSAIEEEIVKSTISNVTVYSQGAQIFRKANYTVKPGVSQIIIDGVSQTIDPKSLQVKATGSVIILDCKYSLFYPKPEAANIDGIPLKIRQDITKLEDSLLALGYDLQGIQDEIDVLNASKSILSNNGAIRGQGKVNDSINLLKQAIDYYTTKMMEINTKLASLNKRKNEKMVIRDGMNARLTKLRNYQNSQGLTPKNDGPIPRITITVQSETAMTGKLDVSYLVSQAGWVPLYDLRSEISAGQVNLNYKANVYQNTGIDWKDVKLTISTNNPYQNKTKPELHPWYIDYNNYQKNYGYAAPNAVNNMSTGIVYDQADKKKFEAYKESEVRENADAFTANEFVTVVDQMISAEFNIDLPYSISSNNEQHMVLIKNVDLKANYKYYTAPKLEKAAYLVAQISKLDELQLVPAKANIFFDGSYIGETYLNPSSLDDTMNLSLGKDPNIIVKRTLLKQNCDEKMVGNNVEKTMAYLIEVKNLKSTNIDIVVQDQLPITQNSEIIIELLESSKAKYNKVTGLLEWDLKIKPKGIESLKLTYKVKHDKSQVIYL